MTDAEYRKYLKNLTKEAIIERCVSYSKEIKKLNETIQQQNYRMEQIVRQAELMMLTGEN